METETMDTETTDTEIVEDLFAPNGARIMGTCEWIPGLSYVGTWEPDGDGFRVGDWSGDTKIFWNGQASEELAGEIVVQAEDWTEWLLSECLPEPPADPDPDAESRVPELRARKYALEKAAPAMLAALKEIAKGEGAFSTDPLTHASNTIDHAIEVAEEAIAKVEGENDA